MMIRNSGATLSRVYMFLRVRRPTDWSKILASITLALCRFSCFQTLLGVHDHCRNTPTKWLFVISLRVTTVWTQYVLRAFEAVLSHQRTVDTLEISVNCYAEYSVVAQRARISRHCR